MSEDTTTTTDAESVQAQEIAQPETSETQAVQAEETNSNEEVSEADTTDQTDSSDELLDWAKKKGIKTDDPKVLLKMVRESEQKMHEATTQANALKTSVSTINEERGLDETSAILNRLTVKEFYLDHPEAKSLDEQMAEIVTAKPYLADDLETVYELAKARSQTTRELEAKQVGQREALAQVAKAEKAAPPNASATTRQTPSEVTDADIEKMSVEEYKNYKASKGGNVWA